VRRSFAIAVACVLMSALVSEPALADPTASEKETARTLVREGRLKRRKGDLHAALEDFAAAHAIMVVPTTGLELGKTQVKAGKLVEALDTLLSVTRITPSPREPRAFRRARAEAKKLSAELGPRIPALRVRVSGSAANGASVRIDDTAVVPESIGAPMKLNPGSHTVVATSVDGDEQTVTVELMEGDEREVTLQLDAPPPADDAVASETQTNPLVYAGFAVGGAGLIVGAVTGALAIDKYGEVAPQCPAGQCPPETHDDIDAGTTLGTVSTVGFIVGGVGLAAGIVGIFLPLESGTDAGEEGAEAEVEDTALWLRLGAGHAKLGLRW
jgi:hypothetical protein